ncbi:MAG TPA: AarF/UbiB family protein [Anaerolineales bacterium]|jgi:predicted unusual protein kinase regulating ubiquinone biosynthesis (AarF/ABC1/UbiB family)
MKASSLRARYWRIVFFFGRVTASFIFWEIILPRIGLKAITRNTRPARYKRIAERFRSLAIHMGGLMIKVGQFLSARLDVLPAEITDELSGLQDEVPAEDFQAIRKIAEADLGVQLAEKFEWFDETPMAAASLGQVHRARLQAPEASEQGFSEVVVKVQRPFIDQIVDVDLSALRRVGGWLQRYKPISDRADVHELVEEFANTTLAEIDYLAEGHNAETFEANFKDNPRVHVPKVVWRSTTRRVLTLENVFAIKLGDYEAISAAGIERSEVATLLLDTYMQQIFEDGFFHADPHPGNLFVTPLDGVNADGKREWKLTFIDFGMVGRMPESLRAGLREAVIAVGTRDAARLVQAYKTLDVLLPTADLKLIEMAGAQVFDRFWGKSMSELRQVNHAEMMKFGMQFRELMFNMPFQLPQNLLMLGRTMAILSGMCTGLDPEFNLWTSIAPYANKLVADEGLSNWQTWLNEAVKIFQLLVSLPSRTDRVMTIIERGELSVQTPALNRQVMHLEGSLNRLSGGLVFTALLGSGAILYSSDAGLGKILMGASALPLLWMLFFARGHRPWR